MKRTFDFGKVDYHGTGRRVNRVTVEMEYRAKDDKKVLSVCGEIWDSNKSDIECGGQCLDTIAEFVDDPIFREIYRLWQLYHLNDMHAECKHQADLGWKKIANRKVLMHRYVLNSETLRRRQKLKDSIISAVVASDDLPIGDEDREILSLEFNFNSPLSPLPHNLASYYDLKDSEVKQLGWLRESEHPDGILCKPCPVCGYKYGSSWVYFPIPANDDAIIEKLITTGEL